MRGNLMATNSPMDDPAPTAPPQSQAPKKIPDNDWAKVGKSKKYPEIDQYIQSRIAFHQRFLPTGESITAIKDKKERVEAWSNAVVIIEEFEKLNKVIQDQTRASKRNAAAGI